MQNPNDIENFITGESLSLASIADKFVARGSLNLSSSDDAALDRKLRELKAKQELRKDWILFLVRDVVIFPTTMLFILTVSGYALFTLIKR
jgi:nitrate reductase NapE component